VRSGENRRTPSSGNVRIHGALCIRRHSRLLDTTESDTDRCQHRQNAFACIPVAKTCLHCSRTNPLDFFSLIRLVLSYSGEHDGTPIRSQGGEIIIRGNGQATERHALQREDGIFSQMVARFIEQMACLRRRPGASTRRLLLFADDRALHREKIACSRKERLLSRSQMNDLHVANIPRSKPSP